MTDCMLLLHFDLSGLTSSKGVDGAETFENDLEDPGCSETKATPPFVPQEGTS